MYLVGMGLFSLDSLTHYCDLLSNDTYSTPILIQLSSDLPNFYFYKLPINNFN